MKPAAIIVSSGSNLIHIISVFVKNKFFFNSFFDDPLKSINLWSYLRKKKAFKIRKLGKLFFNYLYSLSSACYFDFFDSIYNIIISKIWKIYKRYNIK